MTPQPQHATRTPVACQVGIQHATLDVHLGGNVGVHGAAVVSCVGKQARVVHEQLRAVGEQHTTASQRRLVLRHQ